MTPPQARPTRHVDRGVEDAAVAWIAAQMGADELRRARDIGGYILDRFYGADAAAFRRRGRKPVALRSLAARPDLPVSESTLWRYVAVAVQCRALPEHIASRLSYARHLELARLCDPVAAA